MAKAYRSGGVGAMMDELERAAADLERIIGGISDEEFDRERDSRTSNPNCRSIKTIMNHVIESGYGDADYIRQSYAVPPERPPAAVFARVPSLDAFRNMLAYTAATLEGRWNYTDEQITAVHIQSSWGVHYDMEQMLEHGIVHILRHRRQVERFLGR